MLAFSGNTGQFSSAVIAAIICMCLPSGLYAQQHGTDPVQLDTGARIYSSTCSACHGPDGDQISGVNLKRGQFRRASNDEDLARIIQNGIPGTMMPPNNIVMGNLVALIAYLHAMRDFKTRKVTLGDPAAGREIFAGKGGCASCHRANGKGSYTALDLSDVGAIRTPSYIEDAVLNPGTVNLPQNRFVRAVTKSGEVITGRRMNEDTLTVQIIDSKARLLSLTKANLKSYQVEEGPQMPSYKDKLTDTERADLMAYLVGLKGEDAPKPVGIGPRGEGSHRR